jgi:hypothetical protein
MRVSDRFKGTGWAREESDVPNARQREEMNERLRKINEEAAREIVKEHKLGRRLSHELRRG